jgi:hypothetical protein
MFQEMLSVEEANVTKGKSNYSFTYGKGKVVYLDQLEKLKDGEMRSGYAGAEWMMPKNSSELMAAVYWAAGKRLPLKVIAPEWVGISHEISETGDIEVIHLFNYHHKKNVPGIILEYDGSVKNAWSISPDEKGKTNIPLIKREGITELRISNLDVYKVIVLEKK